jgi:hypothetical protein
MKILHVKFLDTNKCFLWKLCEMWPCFWFASKLVTWIGNLKVFALRYAGVAIQS